jgi:outer membrane protein OmpA-like peptidoglycan-associated protein
MKRIALAACLFAPVMAPVLAHAQPVTGPYVSLGAGIVVPDNEHYKYNAPYEGEAGHLDFRQGFSLDGSVGYGLGNGLRFEVEINDSKISGNKSKDSYLGTTGLKGAVYTYGALANVLYDLPIALPVPIFPYVGGGVGYEYEKLNHLNDIVGDNYSGDRGSLAFDAIGGVSFPIQAVPGLSATAQYQYIELLNNRNYLDAPAGSSIKISDAGNNIFSLGLRYQIFNPAPVPPPVMAPTPVATPAPAEARTYLVFFDWDKYNLTPRATQIIAQAASDSKTNTTVLDVSGYTDTSGTPTYNQGLSMRRAKAVEAQLVTDGVPQSEISIHAYGETHLLVPTGPGVREPQNRRVEIVLH